MKLLEALEIVRQPLAEDAPQTSIGLACGFSPLHLQTFVQAELRRRLPGRRVTIEQGLYGDLVGNIRRLEVGHHDALIVMLEWSDIDPRLGLRRLGGWRAEDLDGVVESAGEVLGFLQDALRDAASNTRVVCCLPTLPLPPMFPPARTESSPQELRLRAVLAAFASEIAAHDGVRLVGAQALDDRSPPALRSDVKSELASGFPYALRHASVLGASLAALIVPPAAKKGLITDLDGTLWDGVAGDVGAANIGFSLENDAQPHGLYQQLLDSLASAGVLLAIASKNDPAIVDEVFARGDLRLALDAFFPIEVHWERKSRSVRSILDVWNVDARDVVFVDDSPLELAEVQEAFPEIETVAFPAGSDDVWEFLCRLRDLFGKSTLTVEDGLRTASIRAASELRAAAAGPEHSLDDFLDRADGTIAFSSGSTRNGRALDLINKTNQFTLNGRRLDEPTFERLVADPSAFLVTVDYEDRFGPLGTIATVVGHADGAEQVVDIWVMSCRAFSRRIEYHTLRYLFEMRGADELTLALAHTERNGPFRDFISSLGVEPRADSAVRITVGGLTLNAPPLVHTELGLEQ